MNNHETINKVLQKVLAGTTASVIALSTAGCGVKPNERYPNSQSIVTQETTGTSSLSEPPITDLPTTRETTKPTTTEEPTTTKEPTTTEEPTTKESTTQETTKAPTETESKYDLKNVAPERLEFTVDLIEVYENCGKSPSGYFNKFKDYITPEQIINYGETGKGIDTINNKSGKPTIALINCDESVSELLNLNIKNMKRDIDPDIINKLHENGINVFMYTKYSERVMDSNSYGMVITKYKGETSLIPESDYSYASYLLIESFKMQIDKVDSNFNRQDEVYANLLMSNNFWYLYKKTGNRNCFGLSNLYYLDYIGYKSAFGLNDSDIQAGVEKLQPLITPYGKSATWGEINKSLKDRPNWE